MLVHTCLEREFAEEIKLEESGGGMKDGNSVFRKIASAILKELFVFKLLGWIIK